MAPSQIIYINEKSILQIHLLDGSVFEYYQVPQNVYENTIKTHDGGKEIIKKLSKKYRYDSV